MFTVRFTRKRVASPGGVFNVSCTESGGNVDINGASFIAVQVDTLDYLATGHADRPARNEQPMHLRTRSSGRRIVVLAADGWVGTVAAAARRRHGQNKRPSSARWWPVLQASGADLDGIDLATLEDDLTAEQTVPRMVAVGPLIGVWSIVPSGQAR